MLLGQNCSSQCCGMQLCAESGLLAVGHDKGDMRLYQFSAASQEVRAMGFDGRRRPQVEEEMGIPRTKQPPGFQRILQVAPDAALQPFTSKHQCAFMPCSCVYASAACYWPAPDVEACWISEFLRPITSIVTHQHVG